MRIARWSNYPSLGESTFGKTSWKGDARIELYTMSGSGQVKAEPCSRYREPPVQRNPEVEEKEPVSTGT